MRIAVISYYTARSLYLPAPVYLNSHFGSSCKFTYKQDLCQKKHRRNVSFGSTSLTFVSNYGSSRVINRSSRGAFASNIKQKQAKKKNEYTAHEVRKLHNIIASTTWDMVQHAQALYECMSINRATVILALMYWSHCFWSLDCDTLSSRP